MYDCFTCLVYKLYVFSVKCYQHYKVTFTISNCCRYKILILLTEGFSVIMLRGWGRDFQAKDQVWVHCPWWKKGLCPQTDQPLGGPVCCTRPALQSEALDDGSGCRPSPGWPGSLPPRNALGFNQDQWGAKPRHHCQTRQQGNRTLGPRTGMIPSH